MARRTRSSTKSTAGRTTRNSMHGRLPLSPPASCRRITTKGVPAPETAPACNPQDNAMTVGGNLAEQEYPQLARRGPRSFPTVSLSVTGQGVHIHLHRPSNDPDPEAGVPEIKTVLYGKPDAPSTPPISIPRTPVPADPYNPGSVILTPAKARPLRRSPERIGDKRGVRCLYEQDGVLRELGGRARVVAPLSRGGPTSDDRRQSDGTSSDVNMLVSTGHKASGCLRGPQGELLDRHGRPMFSREGTLLMDTMSSLPVRTVWNPRPRLGPYGTEIID